MDDYWPSPHIRKVRVGKGLLLLMRSGHRLGPRVTVLSMVRMNLSMTHGAVCGADSLSTRQRPRYRATNPAQKPLSVGMQNKPPGIPAFWGICALAALKQGNDIILDNLKQFPLQNLGKSWIKYRPHSFKCTPELTEKWRKSPGAKNRERGNWSNHYGLRLRLSWGLGLSNPGAWLLTHYNARSKELVPWWSENSEHNQSGLESNALPTLILEKKTKQLICFSLCLGKGKKRVSWAFATQAQYSWGSRMWVPASQGG